MTTNRRRFLMDTAGSLAAVAVGNVAMAALPEPVLQTRPDTMPPLVPSSGRPYNAVVTLNGWTLLMGQVPMAAAQDGLFPAVFGRLSRRGVPAFGIVLSVSLASVLLLIQASGGERLVGFYTAIVNLSTMTAVVPYVFCAAAAVIVSRRATGTLRVSPVDLIAYAFALFTVWGCGAEAVLYGFLLLLIGIPFYVRTMRERQQAAR